ncbi:lysylphosphatidylglycerol synthase transmembrane domain-containing protein [Larkinella humicola]|uniref:Flippase-like domain-containing protein n=1 Tax=Larkinella humicola TaxID=2607654 RepID=A0A5N1J1W1_9BACT|nr:lysylphosphatidylglycerol synthase transmembrane domain-containing protein [Larkinella humicola]KAA9340388.1 flippase-like domain-containing protein [Larkinella humicola]
MPKYLKTALKIALSALSLWLVFRKIEPERVWDVISRAQVGWLAVATVLFILSKAASAERLRVLFAQVGLRLRRLPNLKLYWLGMYYNLFLPGGIGGDGYKVYLLNRLTGTSVKALVGATLIDRLIGLLPLLYALAVFVVLVPEVSLWLEFQIGWLWLLGIPVAHFVAKQLLKQFMPQFAPAFERSVDWSGLVQGFQMVQILTLLQAVDAPGKPEAYVLLFLVSSIVATIPFTIGGAGARELTFLLGAEALDVPADAAVSVSLLFYMITAVVSLAGVVYSFQSSTLTKDLSS